MNSALGNQPVPDPSTRFGRLKLAMPSNPRKRRELFANRVRPEVRNEVLFLNLIAGLIRVRDKPIPLDHIDVGQTSPVFLFGEFSTARRPCRGIRCTSSPGRSTFSHCICRLKSASQLAFVAGELISVVGSRLSHGHVPCRAKRPTRHCYARRKRGIAKTQYYQGGPRRPGRSNRGRCLASSGRFRRAGITRRPKKRNSTLDGRRT